MNVCVVRFLASLVVVPVVILILLNANTNHVTTTTGTRVAENGAAGSVVEGVAGLIALESKNDDNEKTRLPDDFVESSSPPIDVCARLRKTLRGNATAAEFLRRLLPRMYQQMGLMPSNSRLVLKILLTTTGVGLCNARTLVLDSLVLAALVGADVVLPEVHSLVGSCFKPMKANNTTSSSSAFTCFSQHVPPIARQLEGYFDVQHLRGEWKRFCPSMVLYHDREGSRGPFLQELEHNHHAVVARQSLAKTLIVGSTRSDQNAIVNNVEGRLNKMDVAIRRWLAKRKRSARMKNANYFVVNILRKDLWDWSLPVEDASLGEVRRAIGASLRSPEYITRIATPVVEHLKALGEAAGSGQRFCGAHLRSEPDMQ
ncbi:transmembrane protein, putative [Bodo saltans]|uniref:Transmembrane protein, putative n=1 Tax=Bodo saltans TaxID=75058 RepID=A0A0S4KK78_BODSA|nr:transmembrane protein, putative [Bodo saltans]|eukprot:CUI13271.1 transmembrane protein, putative [Bodo saltans]